MLNEKDSHLKFTCRTSLGKKKVQSLDSKTLHDCEMSITLVPQRGHPELHANCWIKDDEGRNFGMVLGQEALIELHEKLGKAIAEQKLFGD